MPSKFGGVAVDEGTGSRFGGVAVPDPEPPSALERFGQSWWDNSVLKHPIDSVVGLYKSLTTFPDYHQLSPEEKASVDDHMERAFHDAANPTPELAGQVASTGTNAAIVAAATAGVAKGLGVIVPKTLDTLDAATSPDVVRAAVKVLPKGPTALDAYDAFQAEKARIRAARTPAAPVPVLRDANSPAWSQFPNAARPDFPPVSPIQSPLPSGRVPGSAARAATLPEQPAAAPVESFQPQPVAPAAAAAPQPVAEPTDLEKQLQASLDRHPKADENRVQAADRWAQNLKQLNVPAPAPGDDAAWANLSRSLGERAGYVPAPDTRQMIRERLAATPPTAQTLLDKSKAAFDAARARRTKTP